MTWLLLFAHLALFVAIALAFGAALGEPAPASAPLRYAAEPTGPRAAAREPAQVPAAPVGRPADDPYAEIVRSIAALDAEHGAGRIAQAEHARLRRALLDEAVRLKQRSGA